MENQDKEIGMICRAMFLAVAKAKTLGEALANMKHIMDKEDYNQCALNLLEDDGIDVAEIIRQGKK
jgi:uncharacterized protein YutE (UPF0331/DUF86 family)